MFVSRTIHLKKISPGQKSALRALMFASGKLYSAALQNIRENSNINVFENSKLLKSHPSARELGYNYTEKTIKSAHADFAKFRTIKSKSERLGYSAFRDGDFAQRVEPPKEKTIYQLCCGKFYQRDGIINVPKTDIKIKLYEQIRDKKIVCFTIYECCSEFYSLVTYKEEESVPKRRPTSSALGIDLGVTNFCSCVDTDGRTFILDGRYLKHVIYTYTMIKKQIDADKAKQGFTHITKREAKNTRERKEKINSYLNKCVHYIIQHCVENKLSHVVVGHSTGFRNFDLGKKNNLMFSQMPFTKICEKLQHECKKHGLTFWRQDECYTSQASYYDGDSMPATIVKTPQVFSGKRVKRGLYKAKDGRTINADINGAANILVKFFAYTYYDNCNSVPPVRFLTVLRNIGLAEPKRFRS